LAKTNFNVGVIGLVHDHCWGEMEKGLKVPGVTFTAVADKNTPLLKRAVAKVGFKRSYLNWREMIKKESLDIAMVMMENATTHPVVEELAKKGVHIISEKPMAARLSQADAMLRAAKKHGVKLIINWPTAWNPALFEIRRLVQKGEIGQVFMAKARGGHKGPKEIGCSPYFYKWLYDEKLNGAGSLADYAGYGANMFRFVLGKQPIAVSAVAKRLTKKYYVPDDNSVVTLEYKKALGVIETTWSQVAAPPFPYVAFYGTKGTLGVVGDNVHLWTPNKKDLWAPSDVKVIKPKPRPAGQRSALEYMVWALQNNKPIQGPTHPENSRDAQEVIEAAIISSMIERKLRLPLKFSNLFKQGFKKFKP
jgi:predicted dehydrogenase